MTGLARLEESIPSLRRHAWMLLHNSSDADELVQDCLVRALGRLHTLQAEGTFGRGCSHHAHLFVSRWRRSRARREVMTERADGDVRDHTSF